LGNIHRRGHRLGNIDTLSAQKVLLKPHPHEDKREDMREDLNNEREKETPKKRKEHPIFTLFVHAGYTILILSMIFWIVYIEFIL
jgi:hypothetical protein